MGRAENFKCPRQRVTFSRAASAHHAAALSSAIVFANADNILARAVSMSIALTRATPRGAGA